MKILIGVTGSIAAYKAYDLCRALIKKNHQVRVVTTRGAEQFIKLETFKYLGAEEVYSSHDDFNLKNLESNQTVLHIELAKWADQLVIAPLSANTLGRLALGLCDDLLVSTYLAWRGKPVLLFPAMNTFMWQQPRTQEHLKSLSQISYNEFYNPVSGTLACGDIGDGKLLEVESMVQMIETHAQNLKNKKVVITAGATAAAVDPVRYITNPSSGKMGVSIARSFLKAGYEVVVLAGHNCTDELEYLRPNPHLTILKTPTTAMMRKEALEHFPQSALYISSAAIADIEFDTSSKKIKKIDLGESIHFHQAPDVLKEILGLKKSDQKVVGFAAETETTKDIFMEKMKRKPVDLMIGNPVGNGLFGHYLKGFQKDEGSYFFVTMNSLSGPFELTKKDIGDKLVTWFETGKI